FSASGNRERFHLSESANAIFFRVSHLERYRVAEESAKLPLLFGRFFTARKDNPDTTHRYSPILLRDADVFWFGEKPERFFTAFAANATGFHAAEGDAEVAHEPAVYPDGAGVDLFRDAMGAI